MRVLVPTDLTKNSNSAVVTALAIGDYFLGGITFVHLRNLPENFKDLTDAEFKIQHPEMNEEVSLAIDNLNKLVKDCSERGIKADYIIESNIKKDTIKGLADKSLYDLIVMGSLFTDGNKDRPLGNCMKELIRYTTIPVLATKTILKDKIEKVALLSDFNNEYRINENWINSFILKLKAKLFLCCVNTPALFYDYRTMTKRMNDFKMDFDFETTEVIYNDYQFDTGIKHMYEDLDLDLIIMNTHGKKGMDQFGRGGITEQIVDRLEVPILCLPLLDPQPALKS